MTQSTTEQFQQIYDGIIARMMKATDLRQNLLRATIPPDELNPHIGAFAGLDGSFTIKFVDAVRLLRRLAPEWDVCELTPRGDKWSVTLERIDNPNIKQTGLKVSSQPSHALTALVFKLHIETLAEYLGQLRVVHDKYARAMRKILECHTELDVIAKKSKLLIDTSEAG